MNAIKVLIVDDSALVRKMLSEIVDRQPDMEAVGAAPDPLVAREMIRNLNPDVMTLDVEMPKMDGLDFLERVMRLRPMPVVMVSTLTERGADTTLRALELGAVDFVSKPKLDVAAGLAAYADELCDKIRAASRSTVRGPRPAGAALPAAPRTGMRLASTEKLILVGASTGGTEAIRELLVGFPPDAPAIAITQHMPAGFTKSFALRLNDQCRLKVSEAVHGERLLPGHVYIAPGDHHLAVTRSGANYMASVSDGPPVNRHRPSVEVLFRSGAACAGPNSIGIMLTGMGKDGATAMRELRDAGAYNFAQDEATCVVFGMPREAIAAGAVHEVLPLQAIAGRTLARLVSTFAGNRI
ncbi:MAG: chemotaxis response regulator protein-glutamate methylesterase [Burkholderiales bacterium]